MSGSVILNGETCSLDSENLAEYMKLRGHDPDRGGVAVALNEQVVPRSQWGTTRLQNGDRLEIVEPVQGG